MTADRPTALSALYEVVSTAAIAGAGPLASCPTCGDPTLRVGTDVQEVEPVLEAATAPGGRYLRHVYTDREVLDCRGLDPTWTSAGAASLAGRYAVKEAVVKVLRPVHTGVELRQIEVVRQSGGWCTLTLEGAVGRSAQEQGLSGWAVSFAHDGAFSVATVICQHACNGARSEARSR